MFWRALSFAICPPKPDLPGEFGPYTTCYNRFVRWRAEPDHGGRLLLASTVHMIDTSIARAHQHGAGIASNNSRGNGGRISDQLWSMTRLAMTRRCQSLENRGPTKTQSQKSPVNFLLITHGLPKIVRDAEGSRKRTYARLRSQSVAPGGILV
jgi:hypothetical protein